MWREKYLKAKMYSVLQGVAFSSPNIGRCVCLCLCVYALVDMRVRGKGQEKRLDNLRLHYKSFCISEVNHYLLFYSKFCWITNESNVTVRNIFNINKMKLLNNKKVINIILALRNVNLQMEGGRFAGLRFYLYNFSL